MASDKKGGGFKTDAQGPPALNSWRKSHNRRVGMSDYSGRNTRTCAVPKAVGRESFKKEGLRKSSPAVERNLWLSVNTYLPPGVPPW